MTEPSADDGTHEVRSEQDTERAHAYWRANLALVGRCLIIWFVVSYGCGILLVDWLDQFRIGGLGLGFWFAQQGAIWVFLALIAYYAWAMNRLDHRFGVDDDDVDA